MTAEVEGVELARVRKVGGGSWETLDGRFIVLKASGWVRYADRVWWTVYDRRGAFAARSVASRHRAQRDIAEHIRGEAGMGT